MAAINKSLAQSNKSRTRRLCYDQQPRPGQLSRSRGKINNGRFQMFILINCDSTVELYYGPFASRAAAETGAADLGLELYRIEALLNSKVCQSYAA